MFAALVTTVCYMKLKCKVVHRLSSNYFEPQDAVTLLPHEAETLFPHEAEILFPQAEATLLPQEAATLLPQDAEKEFPAIPFITPWAVDGDV